MPGNNILVVQTKYGALIINRNDEYVGRSLLATGTWCENEIDILRQVVTSGDTVVEVGANIGAHTIALSTMVGPTGTVHAFEPQRIIFYHLAGAVAINEVPQVHCHHAGVGAVAGTATVPPVDYGQSGNFGAVSLLPERSGMVPVTGRAGEEVPVVTIDSLNLTACHLLKIDAEGMERDVLAGAKDTIARLRPVIYTEWEYEREGPATALMLIRLGYRVFPHASPGNYNLLAFPAERGVGLKTPELLANDSGDGLVAFIREDDRQT